MDKFAFRPKLLLDLKDYNKEKLSADIMAGLIVGIVALPLAIAFGIASGVTPEKGIITAIIAGLAVSLFGGSRVQIGGPTGAFIVIVYGIIQQYGEAGLLVATILAGVFLILLGVFHLGTIIKYIPYPIVVGFTSGIAVTIFTTQVKDLFGLSIAEEKEMLLILTAAGDRSRIMRAVMDHAGVQSPAHTVMFSLPVESVAGLRSVMAAAGQREE